MTATTTYEVHLTNGTKVSIKADSYKIALDPGPGEPAAVRFMAQDKEVARFYFPNVSGFVRAEAGH